MTIVDSIRAWGWLVHKDLLREWRAPRVVPAMLLLGVVLALVIAMQVDLPRDQRPGVVGGLFWLAMFFAGTVALDRTLASERDDGCWPGLLLYPVAPATVFLAKTTTNFAALCGLAGVLVPAFAAFADVPLLARPGAFVSVVLLANLGFAAVGTVVSALTSGLQQRGGLLVLLLLPLISPVVLGAAQATRLLLTDGPAAERWQWVQLLAAFATLFVVIGALLFEFAIED